jgi:hypothetical protein
MQKSEYMARMQRDDDTLGSSEAGLVTLRQLVWQAVRHLRHQLPFLAEKRAAPGGAKP